MQSRFNEKWAKVPTHLKEYIWPFPTKSHTKKSFIEKLDKLKGKTCRVGPRSPRFKP